MNRQNVLLISFYFLITLILGVLVASFVLNPEGGNENNSFENTKIKNTNSVEYQSDVSQNTISKQPETNESQKISPNDPYKEFKKYGNFGQNC